ncbi:MAG: hypothetical protein KH034_02710 [Lachnospiraceae bacterium]|nr:hypothetical protein [Lachnospiraceae bacterium]
MLIKGITVTLYEKKKTGTDEVNHSIYEETPVIVENVLVSPSTTTEIIDTQNLTGKKAVYTIAIPKGDKHIWENNKVEFFGKMWRVIGFGQKGIKDNIPLSWNEKWMVERYE